ncbi:MAG: putative metal-binding motif-containing protein [Sandaracinaceae bacterium]|nr:putative metal-binding motif-containing protein [Sandaracinaceae bacterium]
MPARFIRALTPIASLLLALAGCAAEGTETGDSGTGMQDGAPSDAGSRDAGADSSTTPDTGTPDPDDAGMEGDSSVPGLQCEACTIDADCGGGSYCVTLPGGGGGSVCLRTCVRDLPSCPPRFDCVDSLIMGREEPVCAPVGERCCVDGDGDDHGTGVGCRGLDCDDTSATVHESASETCNGVDDDCDGTVDEGNPGGGLVCSTGMVGVCASGVTVCDAGVIVCRPDATMLEETCDGVDNDCDANVDEDDMGRALTRPCYDGSAGTEGVGGCSGGIQTCTGGEFRSCVGQTLPGTEVCDGVDNDCDGTADDGDPGAGIACSSSAPGVCRAGTTSCVGGSVQCVSTVAPGTRTETCNGEDDDCDGSTDEDFMVGSSCSDGVGACLRTGTRTCNPGGTGTVCSATPGTPGVETCDGIDNDCDASVDEDDMGRALTRPCYDGPSGTAGIGSCMQGVETCAGGSFGACVGQVLPGTETCNGVDEDCDGIVDDGNPGGGIACTAPQPGICAAGHTRCSGGAIVCVGDITPGSVGEICDYLDNDCDATTDEGFLLGRVCTAGIGECMRSGVTECNGSGSGTQCNAVAGAPATETCDYADNDCDGSSDEGFTYTSDPASPGTPHAIGRPAPRASACAGAGEWWCARATAAAPSARRPS